MNRILLIIKREFLTRVKKKSFVIITIISPLAFALLFLSPAIITNLTKDEYQKIMVIDEANLFQESLINTKYIDFDYVTNNYFDYNTLSCDIDKAKKDLKESDYFGLLYIKSGAISTTKATNGEVTLYSKQQPNLELESHITNCIENKIENIKLSVKAKNLGITEKDVDDIIVATKSNVNLSIITMDDEGNEKEISSTISRVVGYVFGTFIYFFIFMYGSMILRGVIEEKTSRIVEIIVSSVKPFQLMIGKIIGIAMVGATQFIIWMALTFSIVFIASSSLNSDVDINSILNNQNAIEQQASNIPQEGMYMPANSFDVSTLFSMVNFPLMFLMFALYFIGGFLMYASMFAAVGAVVDNETDTQQFTLPISLPLLIGMVMMLASINNPNSAMTIWGSMIPFTSPIIMLARLPMGSVPVYQIITSLVILYGSAILFTWLAGKIYRTGILLYGRKNSWKDIFKWVKSKK